MLRALAEAPAGLTTPQLTEITGYASSWINALGTTRQLMLKQERQGRVGQAGTVAGNRTRASILWRITEEGRRYVEEALAAAPEPVTAPAQDTPDGPAITATALLLLARHAAAARQRAARKHQQTVSRMLRGFWELMLACAYGEEFDAERAFAYIEEAILYYAHGKIRAGEPLTRFERELVEEDAACREEVS